MAFKKIGEYGIIGNGLTLALVGNDGAVDWMCFPYLDSSSVFGAILDDDKGGSFLVQPTDPWDSAQTYIPRTNILSTTFRTVNGEAELIDFMAAGPEAEQDPANATRLIRCIRGIKGRIRLVVQCSPRFEYGRLAPDWHPITGGGFKIKADEYTLFLYSSKDLDWHNEQAIFILNQDETIWLSTTYGEKNVRLPPSALQELLNATKKYWLEWTRAQETGKYPLHGFWQDGLDRSALVLKLLQFRDTGAIAAAASCSLPTIVYGQRNWDYRFSWVRDTSMTLAALYELGHIQEVSLYLDWVKQLAKGEGGAHFEVLYKLREPLPPDGENQLEHLKGYKGSRPVLTGQFNIGQHQHDIYGEFLEMIFSMSRLVGKIDPDYWIFVRRQVDHVVTIWRDKDNGIWELRTGPHHVTHSKVMCWVALDRGIKIAEHYGFPADLDKWKQEREMVREDILKNGFNSRRNTFTQHYETNEVDAALLLIPLVGFLPADDPRMAGTIEAIEKELLIGGIPLRYKNDDGLPGREHGWLICLFWYLRCLIRQKRFDEVEGYLRRVDNYANHLGLFGEEYDTTFQEITGNFPQAFSHIGYAITVLEYIDARREKPVPPPIPIMEKARLLLRIRNLSPDMSHEETTAIEDPGQEVKRIMNVLRGQFYDGHRQRIDYPLIRHSDYYRNFQRAVACLKHFDPSSLADDKARIAFWANVFNALVIHGVIELGINESVKEVPLFFERVQYTIGNHLYTLSDIEHGILRGNGVPPYRWHRRFKAADPRLAFRVQQPDPRIHFALVCASRTCPPIETYTPEHLDRQLDASAQVFINATTKINRKEKKVDISMIFKWYSSDFDKTQPELLRFIAGYLYNAEKKEWLHTNTDQLKVHHTPYDWRLNR